MLKMYENDLACLRGTRSARLPTRESENTDENVSQTRQDKNLLLKGVVGANA